MSQTERPTNGLELIALLEQQRSVFAALRELGGRQRMLIGSDDAQALLRVLADRQRLVDDLSRLGERLAPYRREWSRALEQLEPAARAMVQELVAENDQRLASLLQADQQDAVALSARRDGMQRELSTQARSAQASRAYAAAGVTGHEGMTGTDA